MDRKCYTVLYMYIANHFFLLRLFTYNYLHTSLSSFKIEGTFRLDSPAVLLGYTRDTGKKKSDSTSTSEHSYVSLFMTIEPSLGVAPDVKETVSNLNILSLISLDHLTIITPVIIITISHDR